jgi:phosphopantetheinyl transferase (holo-ACP synthase)
MWHKGGGWGLREYVLELLDERDVRYQQRFEAQTKAVEAALLAAKEAVIKAELAMEKRFDGVNEFRETLSDQAAQFVTLAQFADLKERVGRSEGHSTGMNASWAVMVSVIVAAASVIGVVLSSR